MGEKKIFPLGGGITNYVFLGEAGCGKSEIAVNLALLLRRQERETHLFDLDMTKPLFRTRDQAAWLEEAGVHVHFEEQFADAPTTAGGVRPLLRDEQCYTVLDVGGDYMGARAIGAYAPLLNRSDTAVYYVINPYRPWSTTLERLDGVLGQVLGVSHIRLEKLHLLGNPNLGPDTTAADVIGGAQTLEKMLSAYKAVELLCVEKTLCAQVQPAVKTPVFPIERFLPYPWENNR